MKLVSSGSLLAILLVVDDRPKWSQCSKLLAFCPKLPDTKSGCLGEMKRSPALDIKRIRYQVAKMVDKEAILSWRTASDGEARE